jgi:hypothetical protein
MKAYLITTGLLFGVIAALHVWRAIAEWPHPGVDPAFALGMGTIIALPAALSYWAWRLLRKLPDSQGTHETEKLEK